MAEDLITSKYDIIKPKLCPGLLPCPNGLGYTLSRISLRRRQTELHMEVCPNFGLLWTRICLGLRLSGPASSLDCSRLSSVCNNL